MSESVFLLQVGIKILYFLVINQDYNIDEINSFHPLSLFSLVGEQSQEWLVHSLTTLNIFELIYWFAIAFGLSKRNNLSLESNFIIVLATYGVGLLIWLCINIFLSI